MNNAPPSILDNSDPCSPLSVPPHNTALLLLDFHSFIVASQSNGGTNVLASTLGLRAWAKRQGIFVVHCLIDLRASTLLSRKMATRANGIKEKMGAAPTGTTGEHTDIVATSDEYVFWRPPSHVSALGSYGLEDFCAEHGIKSLLLAGFSTSGCVINTAKGAADKGYIVSVLSDCCGDKSPELQDAIMTKLLVGQCHVASRDELIRAWEGRTNVQKSNGTLDQLARDLYIHREMNQLHTEDTAARVILGQDLLINKHKAQPALQR